MLFGELIVSKKLLSETELQKYLDKAREQKKMIGEVLVAENVISEEQLVAFLKEQGYLRDQESKK